MDVFTDHKSLQYVFTQRYYEMNVHYHQINADIVADALSRMGMGSTTHVEDGKKVLVKDIHILAKLSVRLVESTSGGVLVHPSSK